MKKVFAVLYRCRWLFLLLACLGLAWWAAFDYLVDFRRPDVAFITTPDDVIDAMLDLAEVSEADTVYDLGSGDGRVLLAAAGRGARAVGVEIDPELVERSRQRVREAGLAERVSVRRGDIFKQNLGGATVLTMYLTPSLNAQLRPQLERLRPGTRIVSHMWSLPGAKPGKKLTVKSAETNMEHPVYLWVTPIEWE
jgi:SAM-dependent methyltransferase